VILGKVICKGLVTQKAKEGRVLVFFQLGEDLNMISRKQEN
jgi:hypothetical protein